MKEIEIRDVQNVAQNMFVGSKQHSLFNPVIGNNPNLITSPIPEKPVVLNIDVDIKQLTLAISRSLVAAAIQVGKFRARVRAWVGIYLMELCPGRPD